jgi:hypothetical protein
MQSGGLDSTVRWGNHARTPEEAAAGVPDRLPFVDTANEPMDPDTVTETLTAPTGQVWTFSWPTAGPTDAGALEQESTGRFFVDWTPTTGEDGTWRWKLVGSLTLGTSQSGKGVFYAQRDGA